MGKLPSVPDYDTAIHIDAEDLAEGGVARAYQRLLPELRKFVEHPIELTEIMDNGLPSYKILFDEQEYLIYSAEEPGTESESWTRATYFFFVIVNTQLAGTGTRFYAIMGGNDLSGIFLSAEHAALAQSALPRKSDWPYIPELNGPWYGQFH